MNNELTNKMDDLLVKYLLDETSAEENKQVVQWLSASEENQQYYDDLKLIWKKSLPDSAQSDIDEDLAWEKLQKKITHSPVIRQINSGINFRMLYRIAATVVILFTAGFIIYRFAGRSVPMLTINAVNTPQNDTLPDGSTVALNINSSISYPEKFTGNSREMNLKGEAFFKITPNKELPFIIHTRQLSVRVVGTSFNVKEFNNDSAQIIVETGIVKVYSGADTVLLIKGESVVYNSVTHSFHKSASKGQHYDYYFTKTLVFENTELSEVVNVLNTIFNSKLVITSEQVKDCRLTATFRNESIETIIHILQQTFGLTVTMKNGQTYLNGYGCN